MTHTRRRNRRTSTRGSASWRTARTTGVNVTLSWHAETDELLVCVYERAPRCVLRDPP